MLCGYCHSTFVNGRAEGGALMASQPMLSRLPVMLPLGSCLPVPWGRPWTHPCHTTLCWDAILSRSSSMARMCPCSLALLSCAERHMVSEGGHGP